MRKVVAFILDFVMAFLVFGYLVALATGNTKDGGFDLEGEVAGIAIALIVAYFVVGAKLGGTIWQRILGTARGGRGAHA